MSHEGGGGGAGVSGKWQKVSCIIWMALFGKYSEIRKMGSLTLLSDAYCNHIS